MASVGFAFTSNPRVGPEMSDLNSPSAASPASQQPHSPIATRPVVQLKPRKARPFFARHPWVLDSAVQRVIGQPQDGDVVDLVTEKDHFIARGIYNQASRIRVRLYSWDPEEPLELPFWRQRIEQAIRLRRHLGEFTTNSACRLIYSEADGLSGLIVDRFGPHLVVQVNAASIAVRLDDLIPLLVDQLAPASIVLRADPSMAKVEGIELPQQTVWGTTPEGPVVIEENGVRFGVDLFGGQKTGFYLDQRCNRLAAAERMRDRRVLDLFCYSGGFGLTASLRGGAREVLGIDGSEQAIRRAEANAQLNGVTNVQFRQQDGFRALDELRQQGERFEAVILDPPKFTRNRFNINEALRAYHRINRVGVELLSPEGILVTCSCSGSITREDFLDMLMGVAEKSRREIQVLEQRGPSPDHPVNVACLENEYLKCFICRVI
jgi:23S rRNA (cytosine1962-C5)-methyltransferase